MVVVLVIVPGQVDARKFYSVEVVSDRVVVGEDCAEMVKMAVADILNSEIFENEDKHNRAPFVAPEDGSGGGLVVDCLIEALVE